jgi:hypothetical protein
MLKTQASQPTAETLEELLEQTFTIFPAANLSTKNLLDNSPLKTVRIRITLDMVAREGSPASHSPKQKEFPCRPFVRNGSASCWQR